ADAHLSSGTTWVLPEGCRHARCTPGERGTPTRGGHALPDRSARLLAPRTSSSQHPSSCFAEAPVGWGEGAVGGCGRHPLPEVRSAPARLLAEIDPEGGLADDLVHQRRIGRVEAAA